MSDYNFNLVGQTANYEIKIDTKSRYGYFEHNTLGEDRAGGLWFDRAVKQRGKPLSLELIDYDGVVVLPKQVKDWLVTQEIIVGEEF